MTVRDATFDDYPAIQEIYRKMGMDYSLGEIESPLFLIRKVAVDASGQVIAACLGKAALETMLFLSPELSAHDKVQTMTELQPEYLGAAWSLGLDLVEARIPDDVERKFHKRLCRMGWTRNRDGWRPWSRATHA